ncbi:unnamed protein product [Arctia plantaginis]|uniref:Fringe-like glycosyltransferase domain-containing protein n=1 Tax=Arctia plantaginis TaxID=874455 RepID=A0A8S0YLL6_ARCPL|nr:unnamed protein product [Arctia plantaginis]
MARSRKRGLGYRKMKLAILGLFVFGFFLILTYQNTFTHTWRKTPIPINLSLIADMESLTLDDIFISVKTSKNLATTRLPIILETWFQLAKEQTWFFTDEDNMELQKQTNGHMINTNCTSQHNRDGLNCKMELEYRYYMKSGKKWFCHFDDDDYVNIPRLVAVLQEYNHKQDWYLGKRSSFSPMKLACRYLNYTRWAVYDIVFWFGTGGAGFCISNALALKMYNVFALNGFTDVCSALTLNDDVCIGFLIDYVTKRKVTLTQVPGFHSHIEIMKKISLEHFQKQITFSYSSNNTIDIRGFNTSVDPSRFLSLHCFLFPNFGYCKNKESVGMFQQ